MDRLDNGLSNLKLTGFLVALAGSAFSRSVCEIGLGIYTICFLTERIFFKKKVLPPFPQAGFLAPLTVSLLASLFISHDFWISTRGLWKYLSGFFIFYAGIDSLRTEKDLRRTLWAFLIVYMIAGWAGVVQGITGHDFIYHREPIAQAGMVRITGAFKHYNDYATFLLPGFSMALALLLDSGSRRKKSRMFLSAALLQTLSYALLQTASRSAFLRVSASFFIFIVFLRPSKILFAAVLIFAAAACVIPSPMKTRLNGMFNLRGESAPERLLLMKVSCAMIKESPLFGLGINTYSENFARFKPKKYPGAMYAHNSYLQMAAEIGLVGIFFYLLFIFSVLSQFVHQLTKNKEDPRRIFLLAAGAGIAGILVNALFESLLQSTQLRMLFWWLMGFGAAIAAILIKPSSEQS